MNLKITKKRLDEHLSYDWIKYIVIILAVILLWVVLCSSVLAPRLPQELNFEFVVVTPTINEKNLNEYKNGVKDSVSPQFIEIQNIVMNSRDNDIKTLMLSTFASSKGDVLLIDNYQNDGKDEKNQNYSAFNSYVDGGMVDCLEDAILQAKNLVFDDEYRHKFEKSIKDNYRFNKIDSRQDMLDSIEAEKKRVIEINKQARLLESYLATIDNLGYYYVMGEQASMLDKTENSNTEKKLWGINVAEVANKKVLKNIEDLFVYKSENDEPGDYIGEFAMGLIMRNQNGIYVHDSITALNVFIEKYADKTLVEKAKMIAGM